MSRLAGGPALPAYRPVRGLPRLAPGRTALVQNVETLAHLALIARYGATWFREAGTEAEPGTMLTTPHLADGRISVTEVPLGADEHGLDRGTGRPSRGPVRPRRDRTGGQVPGAGIGRSVRPVLQRPAAHRRRRGAPGRAAPRPPGTGKAT